MELFIIFVLLVVIGLMYNNKKVSDDNEKERLNPGFKELRYKKQRIQTYLTLIARSNDEKVKKAKISGKKISFWDHRSPSNPGNYEVQVQIEVGFWHIPVDNILFYESVLDYSELGNTYDYYFKDCKRTTAYWDGSKYDVKNVRYHLYEMI